MKRLIFIMMFIPAGLLIANRSQAQVSVSINIGNQPSWAPEGYDEAQYYYIPDMDIYYDVPAHQFLYLSNRRWVRTAVLPASYRRFDLYKVHKVAMNERYAYKNHSRDRKQYAQYKGKFDQRSIRESQDNKYTQNKNNWQNNRFKGDNRNGGDNRKEDNHRSGKGHH